VERKRLNTKEVESWSVGHLERKNKKKIKGKGKKIEMSFIYAFVFADFGRCTVI